MRSAIEANDPSQVSHLLLTTPIDTPIYIEELSAFLTPLQFAVHLGHLEVTKFLLDRGANINITTSEPSSFSQKMFRILSFGLWRPQGQFTPLHLAARKGNEECIKLLLAYGADYRITDSRRNLPLTAAQLCNNFSVDDRLNCLDLSIYGQFKEEYLELVRSALIKGRIKEVKFNLAPINFDQGYASKQNNQPLELFIQLLKILQTDCNLTEITLDAKYIFSIFQSMFCLSDGLLTYIRSAEVKVINELMALVEKTSVKKVNLGAIQYTYDHSQMVWREVPMSETYYQYNSLTRMTETRTRTVRKQQLVTETVTKVYDLLTINNHEMAIVAADPTVLKTQLSGANELIMKQKDSLHRIFSTTEAKMAKKIIDADIIVEFCLRLNELLRRRNISTFSSDIPFQIPRTPSFAPCPFGNPV